ncbi:MAG: hypothetical protein Q9174_004558 [Haloplaca sp. 1 TL-2023]
MYWPMGAPQVYAANRKRRKEPEFEDEEHGEAEVEENPPILGLRTSRSGHLIATITATTMTIWQASPTVVLAVACRSASSLQSYGPNVAVLLRPDASIAVVQTLNGFLVTYSITVDPNAQVYQQIHKDVKHYKPNDPNRLIYEQERAGFNEVNLKFRMVIRIDAGVAAALALDSELMVATRKPAAVQTIRWTPDESGKQTSTELTSRMAWMQKGSSIVSMVYDRAMNLAVWIANDGRAYAVQKHTGASGAPDQSQRLFRGYEFHAPKIGDFVARKAAINPRFSLLAIGCDQSDIHVYSAKDYVGSIPLSHRISAPASFSTTGHITCLSYSPDGYCLVAGYERGWATWSVYGKPGATSFGANEKLSESNEEYWLKGVSDLCWINGGFDLLLSCPNDDQLWALPMTKSAVTSAFLSANVSRTFLLSASSLMIYRGFDVPPTVNMPADASSWQHAAIPPNFLARQRPMRSATISHDGRYLAVAGKRGLAHYSISSGRWKTFDDTEAENAFVVRGGMCWYQYVLVAAVETDDAYELHLYSRELGLNAKGLLHIETLSSAAVVISLTGQDSLLVYTYENILYHYILNASGAAVTLVQVGQLALNGIVRSPARVRAVTWILPEIQMRDGDPSQDVAHASVLFLVDGKLVLLQSSTAEGDPKYEMRVIAHNVEYFDLMRDQGSLLNSPNQSLPESPTSEEVQTDPLSTTRGLRDSLWYFDGEHIRCWIDVQDILGSSSSEEGSAQTIAIPTDFYPTAIMLNRGVILGLDSELVQRSDIHFAFMRHSIRTQLFLPHTLRRLLSDGDTTAASLLALRYQALPYWSHALELLLHMVLDDEVEENVDGEESLMPSVISFLSTFPDYLDIVVQCTRKTEAPSWRTLFAYLPSPEQLFEESLEQGLLKTAGGYLLVLNTFQELDSSEQCIRLLQRAKKAGDWDLCKELARFLMALDTSGNTLRGALARMDLEALDAAAAKSSNDQKTPRFPTSNPIEHQMNGKPSGISELTIGKRQNTSRRILPCPTGLGISEDNHDPHSQD